ncbi:MAG: bifunctional pyr operon transcriptional regulator/uracil phosphoribosyltransferase PyrR [Propionibacteriaceae bacterium]|nr:bifunctional pyr operon transcriptional regulator/uracil phosphoribosyltransferase PyrR [Propionibacteriaceae bacterium]
MEANAARSIADESDISRMISRMAHELLERNHGSRELVVLGIPTRGVQLAERLAAEIGRVDGPVALGSLDITLYRDDLRSNPIRQASRSQLPDSITGLTVVLVDDVLYSGRTVAAALDALKDVGRPKAVRLAVLVDRGHRELPIAADVVGKVVRTAADERVSVKFKELDGVDAIEIRRIA